MIKNLLLLFLLVTSCSASTFYISPTGSDSNNGTSTATPWLSPNHATTCGDVIIAASGNYNTSNFGNGHWGTVTCAGNNNVTWLTCVTFDTCKISSSTGDAMWIDKSYWGLVGWEGTTTLGTTNQFGACFHFGPSNTSISIHHVVFANNVANGCMGGGFNSYDASITASVDYVVYVGNIVYNAAKGTTACYSGLNIYQPIASDTSPGTHMYVAGNYSWANTDGNNCAGLTGTSDGEAINLDTFDFTQGGGTHYIQQAVVYNNLEMGNGGMGIEVENNLAK